MNRIIVRYLFGGGIFIVGYFLGNYGFFLSQIHQDTTRGGEDYLVRDTSSVYKYISPLLECELTSISNHMKYVPFEGVSKVRILNEIQSQYPDISLALYVRSLNNGPWFGINENLAFSPASLMKLPIFMTYMKWMEKNPTIMEQDIIPVELTLPYEPMYPASSTVQVGKSYKPKDLLESMIIKSDNLALQSLLFALPENINKTVLTELGIHLPENLNAGDFLTIQQYASLFRILYNAAYLSRDSSEYALSVLARSEFKEGIRQGIPEKISIAHKFGERGYIDEKTKKEVRQLHDCGIVYYKQYPYLLCIMTRGNNFPELSKVLGQTAKIIHEEISKAFPE